MALSNFFKKTYSSFISYGSIGGKIKRLRELRGLSQRTLGLMCGFKDTTADVRIAQYEQNKSTPRKEQLKTICSALEVDEHSIFDADLADRNIAEHALFDIEDFFNMHPVKDKNGFHLQFSRSETGYDENKTHWDGFLEAWYERYQQYLQDGDEKSYLLWKYEYGKEKEKAEVVPLFKEW